MTVRLCAVVMTTEVPSAASSRSSARDEPLDVLRGWAIVLMVLSHVAPNSRIATLAHLPVWLSAADTFVLIAGVVLGMRSRLRLGVERRWAVYRHIWRRVLQLWLVHCTMMLAVVVIHETTGRLAVAPVAAIGGWSSAAWMIPLLRFQSVEYMNILPLFVLFMLIAPLGLELMQRRATAAWLFSTALLFAVSQRYPSSVPLLHPAVGPLVFSIGAWQFIFAIGLSAGFHRQVLSRLYARYSTGVLLASVVVIGALFVLAQFQRKELSAAGLALPERWGWLFAKETWGPGRAVYTLGLLVLAYLALRRFTRASAARATRSRLVFRRWVFEPLSLLGRKSLYCFIVHLVFALLLAAANAAIWPRWTQEMLAVGSLALVFELARRNVLATIIPN